MRMKPIGRIETILSGIDLVSAKVREVHRQQQLRVRDKSDEASVALAYRSCQYCVMALAELCAARKTLFIEHSLAVRGPDGEVDFEENIAFLRRRFGEVAKVIGLSAEQCADPVLQIAVAHIASARNALKNASL
ncbi:MAG: hypothetical protein K2W95_34680 [Candidatus Obscuribacterales bacterium]|nr:hypothetical protein [Candidatus Obscuribacterales bacterium]